MVEDIGALATSRLCTTFCSTKSSATPSAWMRRIRANNSSTSRGERPSEGSSRISSFGSAISPRPIASICCSPPDSVPACWRCRSAKRGKIGEHPFTIPRTERAPPPISTEIEIVAHAHVWENPPAFRNMDKTARNDAAGGSPPWPPQEADRAPPAPTTPEMARLSVDLPAPFEPSTATISPGRQSRSMPAESRPRHSRRANR